MAVVEVQVRPSVTAGSNEEDTVAAVPMAVDDSDMAWERRKAFAAPHWARAPDRRACPEQLPHFNSAFPYGRTPVAVRRDPGSTGAVRRALPNRRATHFMG